MGRYPDIVFHFTKTCDAFEGILAGFFKPSYVRETINGVFEDGSEFNRDFGVPVVSFCDLRVSELHSHMESYGHFGIGLTKDWAIQQGLHPVFYINERNTLVPNFLSALLTRFSKVDGAVDFREHYEYRKLFQIQAFLKHYRGKLIRADGTIIDPYRFADEREWRYVPKFEGDDYGYQFASEGAFTDPNWKSIYNRDIKQRYFLNYNWSDVRYLIVDKASIVDLEVFLKSKSGYGITSPSILTYEQIINDI